MRPASPVSQREIYQTNDSAHGTETPIYIKSSNGCIAGATNVSMAIGSICHEFCHALGGVDLYDITYETPLLDSAGIGDWGVMGRGSSGWNGTGGPVAPCAYTRMILGYTNLTDIFGTMRNVRITDTSDPDSRTYRIWIGTKEYFLISYRRNDRLYSDRNLPGNGILIWHVHENRTNEDENDKKCDLECADGLYVEAGYPLGETPDPVSGSDNLDFWAHGGTYEVIHAGNRGDATDMFDGVRYTRFGPDTNPSTYSHNLESETGIIIENIHWDGDDMVFDVTAPVGQALPTTSYPLFGVGWQIDSIELNNDINSAITTYYLIRYDDSSRVTLVSVKGDSIDVKDVMGENREEIMTIIDNYLLYEAARLKNGVITRENVTIDELPAATDISGSSIEQNAIRSIQKMTLAGSISPFPIEVILGQNFPNPFNGSTLISYRTPLLGTYNFEVYNMLGQRISRVDLGQIIPGLHQFMFSPDGYASGVYLYRITGAAESACNKMIYVR